MNGFEFLRLAVKGWKRIMMPAMVFFIAGLFFLGQGAEIGLQMAKEKSQPCRISASTDEVTAAELAELVKDEVILQVTEVYSVSAEVTVKGMSGTWEICGVDSAFLPDTALTGTIFPEESGMPWLVVSANALKLLKDASGKMVDKPEPENWVNQSVTLTVGGRTVIGKLCGILDSDEEDEPAVFMSRKSAQMMRNGEAAQTVWLTLMDAGCEEAVENRLSSMGYACSNDKDEKWAEWKLMTVKLQGEVIAGAVAMLGGICLVWGCINADRVIREVEYRYLGSLVGGDVFLWMNVVRVGFGMLVSVMGAVVLLVVTPVVMEMMG